MPFHMSSPIRRMSRTEKRKAAKKKSKAPSVGTDFGRMYEGAIKQGTVPGIKTTKGIGLHKSPRVNKTPLRLRRRSFFDD